MCTNCEQLNNAKRYLEWKAAGLRQQNGRYKATQAARLQRKLIRSLAKQRDWAVKAAEKLSFFNNTEKVIRLERKTIRQEVSKMLDDMPEQEDIAGIIGGADTSATYSKGARTAHSQFGMGKVGISFDLVNKPAIAYLNALKTLHLSNYKGSVNRTTKTRLLTILSNAAETGQSYQTTAKEIMAAGQSGIFSYHRAEMIATNEIGKAYGSGNREMVDIYKEKAGKRIEKYWITVQDDMVTDECQQNEDEGWIDIDDEFPSGDQIAPRSDHPRCRCDIGYRAVDDD